MAFGKTLSLGKKLLDDTKLTEKLKKDFLEKGKKSNKSSKVEDDFEKVVTEGKDGKGKTISFIKKGSNLSKDKQVSKRAENLAKKQKKTKKVETKVETVKKGKKVYDKPIGPQPKPKGVKVYDKPIGPLPKPKSVSSKKVQVNKRAENLAKKQKKTRKTQTVKKGKTVYNKPAGPFPKVYKKPIGPKPKNFFQRNKKKIIAGGALSLLPFAIGTDKNKGEGSISGGGNKDKNPPKDFTPKIKTPKTPKVIKKELPKVKSDDYTGRFIDKKGDVAYDSFSDFMAHMTGKPKKRKMPKKTARIIGTGDKLKRKDADKKGAGKGVKFKAFKSGTKDKTIGLKPLPPKSESPGIHKLPAKAKMNMGFKPMFGGGFISSLYDKPEKTEKHKGNTTSARQVKGYGKAKRP